MALGSMLALRNSGGESIRPYCILDRDYHTEEEIEKERARAFERGLQVHVWCAKEIENFVLHSNAIVRFIRAKGLNPNLEVGVVDAQIERFIEAAKDEVYDLCGEHLSHIHKGKYRYVSKLVRELLDPVWSDASRRRLIVPGKSIMAQLSSWSLHEFGIGFNASQIAAEMTPAEIPREVKKVLEIINKNGKFAA